MLTAIKGEIYSNTIIVGEFKTPLTSVDRSSRQNINRGKLGLSNTSDQMNLINICRPFHLKATEYTFFSSAHGTFSRLEHMLGHKTSLSKFKKTEILSSTFSNHTTVRLKNQQEKNCKKTQTHGG